MKQKIFDALKTKFVGVSDEVLDRIATKGAKTITTDDEVATFVDGVTIQNVIESYADFRVNGAISTYEKKHNIKDGKPIEPQPKPKEGEGDQKPKEGENIPEWAQMLMKQNEQLQERLNGYEQTNTAKVRKGKLAEILKDASDSVKNRITKEFDRITFKDEEDFTSWLDDTKKDVEEFANQIKSSKAQITPPKSGGKETGAVNPLVQAKIDAEAKAAEGAPSAIKG